MLDLKAHVPWAASVLNIKHQITYTGEYFSNTKYNCSYFWYQKQVKYQLILYPEGRSFGVLTQSLLS